MQKVFNQARPYAGMLTARPSFLMTCDIALQQKWPTQPKARLAAIRDLLRTTPSEWTNKQIAAPFKGNITKKKLDALPRTWSASNGLALCYLNLN